MKLKEGNADVEGMFKRVAARRWNIYIQTMESIRQKAIKRNGRSNLTLT